MVRGNGFILICFCWTKLNNVCEALVSVVLMLIRKKSRHIFTNNQNHQGMFSANQKQNVSGDNPLGQNHKFEASRVCCYPKRILHHVWRHATCRYRILDKTRAMENDRREANEKEIITTPASNPQKRKKKTTNSRKAMAIEDVACKVWSARRNWITLGGFSTSISSWLEMEICVVLFTG